MSDNTNNDIAALRAEIETLKAALSGKEDKPPKSTFVPETDEQHRDRVHQMRERNASLIPPWMYEACAGGVSDADARAIAATARAPTGRPGMIPEQPTSGGSPRPTAGDGKGWVEPTPLGPPPGVAQADRLMDEQDRRDRAELARRLGKG
jgi:hypothetical protein